MLGANGKSEKKELVNVLNEAAEKVIFPQKLKQAYVIDILTEAKYVSYVENVQNVEVILDNGVSTFLRIYKDSCHIKESNFDECILISTINGEYYRLHKKAIADWYVLVINKKCSVSFTSHAAFFIIQKVK